MSRRSDGKLLHSDEKIPTVWMKPQASQVDLTLIGYGGTADLLLGARVSAGDRFAVDSFPGSAVIVFCTMAAITFSAYPFLLERE